MSVAAPVIPDTEVRSGDFYALVKSVHAGMLSSKVNSLFLDVVSGSVERGDPIEVRRADGGAVSVVAHRLREALGEIVLDLDEPQPRKGDLAGATVAHSPALLAPVLAPDVRSGLERLLAAVQEARREGFPVDWAKPIKPVAADTPERLCALVRSLPDEAVALLVQRRVLDAVGHHGNPFEVMPDTERAAMHLDAIGLRDDGDRLLLTAAAAVQGHRTAVALRAAGTVGAVGVLATENVAGAGLDLGRRIGWAIGIEMGDAFANAFQSNVAAGGEVVEGLLLDAKRAVGVGWCKGCRTVVQATFRRSGLTGSPQHHCPNDDRRLDDVVIVVPADAAEAQEALRTQPR